MNHAATTAIAIFGCFCSRYAGHCTTETAAGTLAARTRRCNRWHDAERVLNRTQKSYRYRRSKEPPVTRLLC